MQDLGNSYDESDNPSNGWRAPDPSEIQPDDECHDAFEDFEGMADLEPGENNPLERPKVRYNPLNHAYPMIASTEIGTVEVMVRFTIVRGRSSLPTDLVSSSHILQVPMIIEDIPVSKEVQFFTEDYDFSDWKSPDEIVAEGALVSEMTGDERYYLVPMIVRARRLASGEGDNLDSWEMISKEEIGSLISDQILLDLIVGYAAKVKSDPDAPAGLIDLLQHFTRGASRNRTTYPDAEWNPNANLN
jgi:hypothetical protein